MHVRPLRCRQSADAFLFERYAEGRGAYSLTECWHTARERAKLGRLRLHDLRYTVASHAVMSGENLPQVGKLLGHRRHRTTAGYAHSADGHLVEAAERVGFPLSEKMEARAGYRYFATADADFDGVEASYGSHSIEAGIRFRF